MPATVNTNCEFSDLITLSVNVVLKLTNSESKRIYMECRECGFARTFPIGEASRNETRDCEACGGEESFGPGRYRACVRHEQMLPRPQDADTLIDRDPAGFFVGRAHREFCAGRVTRLRNVVRRHDLFQIDRMGKAWWAEPEPSVSAIPEQKQWGSIPCRRASWQYRI